MLKIISVFNIQKKKPSTVQVTHNIYLNINSQTKIAHVNKLFKLYGN